MSYELIVDLRIRIDWLQFRDASLCEEISGKTYSRGCQRPTPCGRMSKLAFLIVRRLCPGELLIFMQMRQRKRCETAFCKTISNLKPKHIRPTNIQRDPFSPSVFTRGEVIFAPKDCSNYNGGTLLSAFIVLSLLGEGGRPGCDLNLINGSLAAFGLDLSQWDLFQTSFWFWCSCGCSSSPSSSSSSPPSLSAAHWKISFTEGKPNPSYRIHTPRVIIHMLQF